MEFLRRLLGFRVEEVAPGPALVTVPARDDAVLDIVGEQSYQDALRRVGAPFDAEGPRTRDHVATLTPEPKNRYDANAIRIDINGHRVGYLSRENALLYGPVVRWEIESRTVFAVRARLTGGWDRGGGDRGSIGVKLNLGSPVETWLGLVGDGVRVRTDHRWAGSLIAFTGDSTCRVQGMLLDRGASEALARSAGLSVHPRVTKKVGLLVDCDATGASGNERKAREYGIPVVSEREFWLELALPIDDSPWVAGSTPASVPAIG